jgi:hypothetical protein
MPRYSRTMDDLHVHVVEGAAAFLYPAIGLFALALGMQFLGNFLPLGSLMKTVSGGTVFALNVAVGLAVWAGISTVILELLQQAARVRLLPKLQSKEQTDDE